MEKKEVDYNSFKDFTTLEAWKKSMALKLLFYREITPLLPSEEKFNLCVRVRRTSINVTAHISEDGRYNHQKCIQFYRMARSSIYELKDHITSCFDLNFIDKMTFDKGIFPVEEAKKTLNGYIRFVKTVKEKKT